MAYVELKSIKWNCTSGLCVTGGDSCSWPPTGFDVYTMEMRAQHRAHLEAGGCEYRVWVSEEDEDGKSVYANLPSFVKERNLVLMRNINPFYEGSGDPPYTIPLPYGYNVLHVLGVNTMETILGLISPQDAAA